MFRHDSSLPTSTDGGVKLSINETSHSKNTVVVTYNMDNYSGCPWRAAAFKYALDRLKIPVVEAPIITLAASYDAIEPSKPTPIPTPTPISNPILTDMYSAMEFKLKPQVKSQGGFESELERWETAFEEIEIEEVIASGNFGTVSKAEWRNSDVVVKQLTAQLDEQQLAEFRAEAIILMRLRPHNNVVQFLAVCSKPPNLCMVSEYLPLGDLVHFLRKTQVNMLTKVHMAKGAAAGISHLHNEKIIHRDIAARNLLVSRKGGKYDVKVTDFGMSKQDMNVYASTTGFGPLRWMAPESLDPESSTFSTASDCWMFGVTIWEILTNCATDPFPELTPMKAGIAVMMGKRLTFPSCNPTNLIDTAKSCMATAPNDRPSFSDIFKSLKAVEAELLRQDALKFD
eukprot:TRINITY_DN4965_c0_g2_i1.p1 TRINITY_DN4965_c0_g2~~TRINITY_DN4965_c0_g2_i1.p1  ORF type:complete len:399 (+),score=68.75 TRINITY_DN4965_c0_g2_i1:277-1473(+)